LPIKICKVSYIFLNDFQCFSLKHRPLRIIRNFYWAVYACSNSVVFQFVLFFHWLKIDIQSCRTPLQKVCCTQIHFSRKRETKT
jgi:hypothetical protein